MHHFTLPDESATDRFGAALAELLPDGTVVALTGPLGAGKTRLVQAVASAVGIAREEVTSPTFVFIQEYEGRRTIYHFDAFRLADEDEFLDLGPGEYFDAPALTWIEWADRVENCLPEERIEIRIEPLEGTQRAIALIGHGPAMVEVAARVANRVQSPSADPNGVKHHNPG